MQLTSKDRALINAINWSVNKKIIEKAEPDGQDEWRFGEDYGDCEDYALVKKQKLIESRFPKTALRLTHVKSRDGQNHIVLSVVTDNEWLILDNLHDNVLRIEQAQNAGYVFIKREAANGRMWEGLDLWI